MQLNCFGRQMFDALKEYKKNYGNYNVPSEWAENNLPLGRWVSRQRTNYHRRELSEDRIKRSGEIGFEWNFHKG